MATIYDNQNCFFCATKYTARAPKQSTETEKFYKDLEEEIHKSSKKEILIAMGDLNAKVGITVSGDHLRKCVEKYRLGKRNERSKRLLQFAVAQCPSNTEGGWAPGHHQMNCIKNHIYYITIQNRWQSSWWNAKTKRRTECSFNQRLRIMKFRIRLQIQRKQNKKRWMTVNNKMKFVREVARQLKDEENG